MEVGMQLLLSASTSHLLSEGQCQARLFHVAGDMPDDSSAIVIQEERVGRARSLQAFALKSSRDGRELAVILMSAPRTSSCGQEAKTIRARAQTLWDGEGVR